MTGKNIFIDFSIVLKSNASKLIAELDQLIALKNNIFLWSNTYAPSQMRYHCMNVKANINDSDLFKKVRELRRQKKSFPEISTALNIPVEQIGFYLTADPNKTWTLDDFIKDYFVKDSSMYPKADFVIDPNSRFVERFQLKGLDGNCIEKI